MKKLLFLTICMLLLVSCGPGKPTKQAKKATFEGKWVLENIYYPSHTGIYDVTLLNDASADCFRQSLWVFRENKGNYNLQGEGCGPNLRHYKWQVDDREQSRGMFDFLLEPTNNNYNSLTGGEGFRLYVLSLSDNQMVWEQSVTLEGRDFLIRMEFTRL